MKRNYIERPPNPHKSIRSRAPSLVCWCIGLGLVSSFLLLLHLASLRLVIRRVVLMDQLILLCLRKRLVSRKYTSKSFLIGPRRVPFPKWMRHRISSFLLVRVLCLVHVMFSIWISRNSCVLPKSDPGSFLDQVWGRLGSEWSYCMNHVLRTL